MKRNLTFQVTENFYFLVDVAAHKVAAKSRSEYCRQALRNQLFADGFLDDEGVPLKGVIEPKRGIKGPRIVSDVKYDPKLCHMCQNEEFPAEYCKVCKVRWCRDDQWRCEHG